MGSYWDVYPDTLWSIPAPYHHRSRKTWASTHHKTNTKHDMGDIISDNFLFLVVYENSNSSSPTFFFFFFFISSSYWVSTPLANIIIITHNHNYYASLACCIAFFLNIINVLTKSQIHQVYTDANTEAHGAQPSAVHSWILSTTVKWARRKDPSRRSCFVFARLYLYWHRSKEFRSKTRANENFSIRLTLVLEDLYTGIWVKKAMQQAKEA